MLSRSNYSNAITSSQITPETVYHERRALMKLAASAMALAASPLSAALSFEKQKSSLEPIV